MQIDYEQAAQIIRSGDYFHIITHQSPDGDTLGSGFAMFFALRSMGKKAAVICPDGLPDRFRFLAGDAEYCEEFEPQCIIAVDIADPKLMGDAEEKYRDKVRLCIDHHISNTQYAENTLLNASASAACEVIYRLFGVMGVKTDDDIARCLYTGVATDTGCFRYSNSTPEAHMIAADLIKYNIDFAQINREMFDIKSRARLYLEQHIFDNMSVYFNDRLAVLRVTGELCEKLGADMSDLDGVASLPLQIQGMEVAVTMKEKASEEFKVSMRSAGRINVSEICRKLGGGGHVNAAGCLVRGTADQAEKTIADLVGKALEEYF